MIPGLDFKIQGLFLKISLVQDRRVGCTILTITGLVVVGEALY